uniref:High potential iron-sulfur proteins family profile domain-containing protein n=1 Tax=viral metagenome TaxID=1070528 RepID=A0A6M3IJH4_9ZZZZ
MALEYVEGEKEKDCCANCKFWKTNENPFHPKGYCKRNAPTKSGVAGFPETLRDNWCGEFKR